MNNQLEAKTGTETKPEAGLPAATCSALWMFFAARFREEYGFEPNPRDKGAREKFAWYGWGHAAHGMGWGVNRGSDRDCWCIPRGGPVITHHDGTEFVCNICNGTGRPNSESQTIGRY
jgi:hypothetical protein